MLGRRAELVPALVIATYRDDELAADDPLRSVVGELRAGDGVRRLPLPPLSLQLRNSAIAARLVVSEKTVDHHVSAILRKLGVHTRGEAAAEATRLGMPSPR